MNCPTHLICVTSGDTIASFPATASEAEIQETEACSRIPANKQPRFIHVPVDTLGIERKEGIHSLKL